jgi:NAD-dependent dihydropyrimidine dehydrogenase PreA subunit
MRVRRAWIALIQTLLRMLPFPTATGLQVLGRPDRRSPVLLTGNFGLTVERVKRALEGVDAHLLVANSRGVNVWCAATGGLLTDHDVVSVLKTSGVEDRVDHRHVILPQLAATGIDARTVREKTGWHVVWGPVEAEALPAFLDRDMRATRAMRRVRFPWRRRLEMAVAWAFPISLVACALAFVWPAGVLPVVGIVWGVSLLLFLGFPLYRRRLAPRAPRVGFVFFDFGQAGVLLLLWAAFLGTILVAALLGAGQPLAFTLRWGLASGVVLLILGLDLTGSTPLYKSGLHDDRLLAIELDEARCRGAGFCETVCPKDVFEVDHHRKSASLPRADACVQCGACIVQCPFDALHFRSPAGERVGPETVRRFKLNLIGTRTVDLGGRGGASDAADEGGDGGR